jgi:hypothetical protein
MNSRPGLRQRMAENGQRKTCESLTTLPAEAWGDFAGIIVRRSVGSRPSRPGVFKDFPLRHRAT